MNGYTLQTGQLARREKADNTRTTSLRLAGLSFSLMMILALALGVSLVARADTTTPASHSSAPAAALPESINFMTGMIAITWTYRSQDSMPFTEHHAITSAQVADALKRNGPVRVPTNDEGELLIGSLQQAPGVILSARHYADWTLVSVLRYTDNPAHSVGVFKFCSAEESNDSCVHSIMSRPDGTVSITSGLEANSTADAFADLDSGSVASELIALLTL